MESDKKRNSFCHIFYRKDLFIKKKCLILHPDCDKNKTNKNLIYNEKNISTFEQEKEEQARFS